jgi:hypothetical protein
MNAFEQCAAADKELYYLTCEMHAELWRLERMAQAYRRFEAFRLRTGMLSAQASAALRQAKPFIAAEDIVPSAVALELRCAADALAGELLRVEHARSADLRLSDFNVQTDLLTRLDKLRETVSGSPAAPAAGVIWS